jgi:hypothetical protein
MAKVQVEESATIDAAPGKVYGIIADYREGHPRILPGEYFSDLVVVAGGVGAGTVITFTQKAAGRETKYRMRVEEPEPGRVLVERDLKPGSDITTTFTVAPADGGKSRVTISTEWTASKGIRGLVERLGAPGILRTIYREELRKLQEVATK